MIYIRLSGRLWFCVAIPASITDKPPSDKKVAEGQDVTITCGYVGAPRVTVVWRTLHEDSSNPDNNRQNINDPRFVPQSNGDLLIKVGAIAYCFMSSYRTIISQQNFVFSFFNQ